MSSLDAGLLVAVALLTVLTAGLLRAQATTSRQLLVLERRLNRADRRPVDLSVPGNPAGEPAGDLAGDAVDIRGLTPAGDPVTIELESPERPVLLVFLSTSCGICTSIWERLRDQGLGVDADVRAVVVTKDSPPEDLDRVRTLVGPDEQLAVVLSSEAWVDYEVPGSPYLMVVAGQPASVVDEGSVTGWDGLAAMVGRVPAGR